MFKIFYHLRNEHLLKGKIFPSHTKSQRNCVEIEAKKNEFKLRSTLLLQLQNLVRIYKHKLIRPLLQRYFFIILAILKHFIQNI